MTMTMLAIAIPIEEVHLLMVLVLLLMVVLILTKVMSDVDKNSDDDVGGEDDPGNALMLVRPTCMCSFSGFPAVSVFSGLKHSVPADDLRPGGNHESSTSRSQSHCGNDSRGCTTT